MPFAFILFDSPLCNENDSLVKPLIILFIPNSSPSSRFEYILCQYIDTQSYHLPLSLPVLKYAFPYKPLPNNCILCPAENTIKIPY